MQTILLVDTEPGTMNSHEEVLMQLGYRVIMAPDGRSGLEVALKGSPVDLLITECRIADMDGLAFVETIKEYLPRLPVIVLTKHSSIETYIRALSLGVFEYVNAPVSVKELRRIVTSALKVGPQCDAVMWFEEAPGRTAGGRRKADIPIPSAGEETGVQSHDSGLSQPVESGQHGTGAYYA
jgi:DNA-binding NtrC family response regulator